MRCAEPMTRIAVGALVAALAGCDTLPIADVRWTRLSSTAPDAAQDRAACLDGLAAARRPRTTGGIDDTTRIQRALDAGGRHEQMAACMRARGWDVDPRDRRESAGRQMDRAGG
jgi:hypothetical protein